MSIRVMSDVWAHSTQKGSALLVLLAIADNANDQGVAWPSEQTIADKARMSERQVRRLLHQIAETGELEIETFRKERSTRNRYRVLISPGQVVRMNGSPGQNGAVHPDIAVSAEPSVEPSLTEPKGSALDVQAGSQNLTGWFVDESRRRGSEPPRRVIGQMARQVGELVAEGHQPERIRAGIRELLDRGLHPSALPSAVHTASLPRKRVGPGITADELYAHALQLEEPP